MNKTFKHKPPIKNEDENQYWNNGIKDAESDTIPFIQPKLLIGSPDDPLEREADAMAEKVMKFSMGNKITTHEPAFIQRQSPDSSAISPAALNHTRAMPASDHLTTQLQSSKGTGDKLPDDTRAEMEAVFNADFSDVRIHAGQQAIQMNKELNAKAFTVGPDIYFNSDNTNFSTSEGKELLGHELAHVVQQQAVSMLPFGNRSIAFADYLFERETTMSVPGVLSPIQPKLRISTATDLLERYANPERTMRSRPRSLSECLPWNELTDDELLKERLDLWPYYIQGHPDANNALFDVNRQIWERNLEVEPWGYDNLEETPQNQVLTLYVDAIVEWLRRVFEQLFEGVVPILRDLACGQNKELKLEPRGSLLGSRFKVRLEGKASAKSTEKSHDECASAMESPVIKITLTGDGGFRVTVAEGNNQISFAFMAKDYHEGFFNWGADVTFSINVQGEELVWNDLCDECGVLRFELDMTGEFRINVAPVVYLAAVVTAALLIKLFAPGLVAAILAILARHAILRTTPRLILPKTPVRPPPPVRLPHRAPSPVRQSGVPAQPGTPAQAPISVPAPM